MTNHFITYAPDGTAFRLNPDRTWELEMHMPQDKKLSFRDKEWGSSIEEIKRLENSQLEIEDQKALVYNSMVANFPVSIYYWFNQDRFTSGMYEFSKSHANDQDYYFDYLKLKELYESKFGPPDKYEEFWTNDLYRDDFDQRGFAASLGHYACFYTWTDGTTDLILQFSGDNYEIEVQAVYRSIHLKGLRESEAQKHLTADL